MINSYVKIVNHLGLYIKLKLHQLFHHGRAYQVYNITRLAFAIKNNILLHSLGVRCQSSQDSKKKRKEGHGSSLWFSQCVVYSILYTNFISVEVERFHMEILSGDLKLPDEESQPKPQGLEPEKQESQPKRQESIGQRDYSVLITSWNNPMIRAENPNKPHDLPVHTVCRSNSEKKVEIAKQIIDWDVNYRTNQVYMIKVFFVIQEYTIV